MPALNTLSFGFPLKSFDASSAGATTNGTAFALPGSNAAVLTYQTIFSATPSAISILIEASLDDVSYSPLVTLTDVAGEIGNITTAAKFIRASITGKTGSFNTTVILVAAKLGSGGGGGGASLLTSLLDVDISSVADDDVLSWDAGTSLWVNRALGSVVNPFDQDLNTTDDVIFNSLALTASLTFALNSGIIFTGGGPSPTTMVGSLVGAVSAVTIDNADEYIYFSYPHGRDEEFIVGSYSYYGNSYMGMDPADNDTIGSWIAQSEPRGTGDIATPLVAGRFKFVVNDDFNYNQLVALDTSVVINGDGDVEAIYTHRGVASHVGAGTITTAVGQYGVSRNEAAGIIDFAWGNYSYVDNLGLGTINNGSNYHGRAPVNSGGGVFTNFFGFWTDDLGTVTSDVDNLYYEWADARGVYAIKEEFTQAVPRQYNPLVVKYTPGEVNHERQIGRYGLTGQYGIDNIFYLGQEAGGTGTLRKQTLLGAGIGFEATPGVGTYLEGIEIADPSAPAANAGVIYFKDNGAGKTQLVVRFSSGAVQQIAIQP